MPFVGYAYSSTNPDLPNSNTGENLIAEEYLDERNPNKNIIAWMDGSPSSDQLDFLLPRNPNTAVNPTFVAESLVSF